MPHRQVAQPAGSALSVQQQATGHTTTATPCKGPTMQHPEWNQTLRPCLEAIQLKSSLRVLCRPRNPSWLFQKQQNWIHTTSRESGGSQWCSQNTAEKDSCRGEILETFTFCKNFFHHEVHFQTAQDICDGHCWANLFYNVYIGWGRGEWRGWTWRCSCVTALTVYEMDIFLSVDPEEQMFLKPCNLWSIAKLYWCHFVFGG